MPDAGKETPLNNLKRITLSAFLAYFVMSGMLAPIGIISGPMAEHFGVEITELTSRFSWLTLGIWVGAVIALWALGRFSVRRLLIGLYICISLALLSLAINSNYALIWPALGLVGVACGIGLPAAAFVIAGSYIQEKRASMLVITDGCFSVAGIVCAKLATLAVAAAWHWSATYLFVAAIALIIVGLALVSRFPDAPAPSDARSSSIDWPIGVWLCIGALGLYTLGQYSLLLWLPSYLEIAGVASRTEAGGIVARYWMGMFAAQIFVSWWVYRIGVTRLLVVAALACALVSVPLWLLTELKTLLLIGLVFGFANLGLLKIAISFATELPAQPGPRLVSALLLGATTGTAVSPWITSQIVRLADQRTVLMFGSGCFIAMSILLLLAIYTRQAQAQTSPAL